MACEGDARQCVLSTGSGDQEPRHHVHARPAAVANVQRTFYEHHKASTAQAQKHVANIDKMRKYGEFLRQSLPGFAARQAAAKKRKRTQAANKAAKKARRAPGGDGSGGAGAGAGAGARSGSGTDV